MIKYVKLNCFDTTVWVDMGMTQYLKKRIEDTYLEGHEITKCVVNKISKTRCNVEFITIDSLNIIFKGASIYYKEKINPGAKARIFSFNYITTPYEKCNDIFLKPDSFPKIEVIFNQV